MSEDGSQGPRAGTAGAARVQVAGGSIAIVLGDITRYEGDAIVNAANPGLAGGGGVDGAIHRAAGRSLTEECAAIVRRSGPLSPGSAVATNAGDLPARRVVHTVGPVWRGGDRGEPAILASAYRESVLLAAREGLRSLAFPSISTGAYGYPVRPAAAIAVGAVRDALAEACGEGAGPIAVTFVLFDEGTYAAYASALGTMSEDG